MNILFIGAINRENSPGGGEEYKNQLFVKHFAKFYTLTSIDTYHWRQKPFEMVKLFWYLFFIQHDRILISASSLSVYRLVQLIYWNKRIASKTIYFVIGGYFPHGIEQKVFKAKFYNYLSKIVVEGEKMKKRLIQNGINTTVEVLPNFKDFPQYKPKKSNQNTILRFVFLSRVHPDKGISDIIDASKILRQRGIYNFNVTFYGPVEKSYLQTFKTLLSPNIYYGGVLDLLNDPKNAYNTLSSYDVMLFPTFWKGEGFPGVIIDAFVAGLPIIATDWNMNGEVLADKDDSIIIPVKEPKALAEAMYRFIINKRLAQKMGRNSMNKARDYHIDYMAARINGIVDS